MPAEEIARRFEGAYEEVNADPSVEEEQATVGAMMSLVSQPVPVGESVPPVEAPSASSAPQAVTSSEETITAPSRSETSKSKDAKAVNEGEAADKNGDDEDDQDHDDDDDDDVVGGDADGDHGADDDDDDDRPFLPTTRARRSANVRAKTPHLPQVETTSPTSPPPASRAAKRKSATPSQSESYQPIPKRPSAGANAIPRIPKRQASVSAKQPASATAAPRREVVVPARSVRSRPVRGAAAAAMAAEEASPVTREEDSAIAESELSDNNSEDMSPMPPRRGQKRSRRAAEVDEEDSTSDYEEQQQVISTASHRRDHKSKLIASVLSRWWYVMDDWPPPNFDYATELKKRKYKQVSFDQWEEADDIDAEGFTKVYEITHFPGMYRDPRGAVIDMRPLEGKPCYSNLNKLSEGELTSMLVTALRKQIEAIENSPYRVTDELTVKRLKDELMRELKRLE